MPVKVDIPRIVTQKLVKAALYHVDAVVQANRNSKSKQKFLCAVECCPQCVLRLDGGLH